jgi:hypothetical protein
MNAEENAQLRAVAAPPIPPQGLVLRVQFILLSAPGDPILPGLHDALPLNRRRTISDAQLPGGIRKTLPAQPPPRTSERSRSLAAHARPFSWLATADPTPENLQHLREHIPGRYPSIRP